MSKLEDRAEQPAASIPVHGAAAQIPPQPQGPGAEPAPVGSEARVMQDEKDLIARTRVARVGVSGPLPWCGLGLSGGGIRSASLGLGVLQGLAERDLLKRFDYISSVSGGGYIATSLQWWWSRPREDRPDPRTPTVTFGVRPPDFPYGPARPQPRPQPAADDEAALRREAVLQRPEKNLAFLRAHSSYLTPGNGLSLWSILGVLLRTVAISLLTWIPILTAFFIAVIYIGNILDGLAASFGLWSPLGPLMPARWVPSNCRELDCVVQYPAIYAIALWVFYAISVIFAGAAVLFAFVSRAPQDPHGRTRTVILHGLGAVISGFIIYYIAKHYSSIDLLMLLIVIGASIYAAVALLIVASELITTRSLNASYWVRRSIERLMGIAFIPSLALLASSTIPILPYYAWQSASATHLTLGGIIGLASGVGSALYGYYTFLRNIVPGLVGQIAATIGSIVYLYVTLLMAYVLAIFVVYYRLLPIDWSDWLFDGLIASIVMGFAIGLIANVNYVGFHRFYRDRLMEAFMPTDSSVTKVGTDYSPIADNLSVADLRPFFAPPADDAAYKLRPYPLINTNAILVNDDNQTFASRGGDNFLISPLYVGSRATGWQDSLEYIDRNGPLTLASAMAASGAAANASAGYIGTGITMNPLVSAVMSLLNIRLGLWVGNPFHKNARRVRTIPTFLMAGIFPGFIGALHRHDSSFLELTDGGHFENLGVYELVRRKLDVIVIVDGEEDPTISLSSLVSAARRIEQDFGARLSFVSGKGPERLVMYPATKGYPSGVRYAEAPFLVGEVNYKDGPPGTLIYLKATIIKDIDFTTAGYLAANPAFPHQTTADQFFHPDQFDAYRLLGYESVLRMIDGLNLAKTIASPASILTTYNEPEARTV
jgi:Patatin-like phospholipase